MRALFLIPLTIASLLTASSTRADEPNPTEPSYTYSAVVVAVVDGDTIDVDVDLGFYVWIREQRIQLFGVDSPEPRGETKAQGDAATAYLDGLIGGKEIILRTIAGKDRADRDELFGHWLGVVYLDGKNINEMMIDAGHAIRTSEE